MFAFPTNIRILIMGLSPCLRGAQQAGHVPRRLRESCNPFLFLEKPFRDNLGLVHGNRAGKEQLALFAETPVTAVS